MESHILQECIMDTSFVRRFYVGFSDKFPNVELIGTFYNFIDLLVSKNLDSDKIDDQLEIIKDFGLRRIVRENIIIWEPFYEIIVENYPKVRIGKTLFDRIEEDFLPQMSEVTIHGKNISQELKEAIIKYAIDSRKKKEKQMKDFVNLSRDFKEEIIKEGNNPNDILNWVSKVETLLKNLIWKYATIGNFLPSGFKPDMKSFSIDSCELFINSMAFYLKNDERRYNPGLNDNIDALSLLYVRKGRKLLMRDDKWIGIINKVGLSDKYLHPLE